jgi:hypothetical protein
MFIWNAPASKVGVVDDAPSRRVDVPADQGDAPDLSVPGQLEVLRYPLAIPGADLVSHAAIGAIVHHVADPGQMPDELPVVEELEPFFAIRVESTRIRSISISFSPAAGG